jgi:hypothetical protein
MFKKHIILILIIILTSIIPTEASFSPKPETPITPETWIPQPGDRLLVETDINMGHLIKEDGTRLTFAVATGQRRYVAYLGMYYYAATPKQEWVAKESSTQPDRFTFGEEGLFIRMFVDGKRTRYGIHTIANADDIFARESQERYASMGCTLVTQEILDIIEETFKVNGGELHVLTI